MLYDGAFVVPKSDDLPPQSIIDSFYLNIGIGKGTNYHPRELEELAVRSYQEVWRLMREGKTLDDLEKMRPILTYEIHKKWHEEK